MVLDFIKDMLKQEQGKKKADVELNALSEWFESATKDKMGKINHKAKELFLEAEGDIANIRRALEALGNAELRNKNIPEKVKQIMNGNRSAYIKRTEIFCNQMQVPIEKGLNEAKEYAERFGHDVEDLNKSTAKPYYVLQEFLKDESFEVAKHIKKLDDKVKGMKKLLEESKIEEVNAVQEMIAGIKEKVKNSKELRKRLFDEENHHEELVEEESAVTAKLKELESSPDYEKCKLLREESEAIAKSIKEKENDMSDRFSLLDAAMKKYKRMAMDDKVIELYIESAPNELLKDSDLKIVTILSKIKENIANGTIDLKDKKKEKTIERIESLTSDFLMKFRQDIEAMKHKRIEVVKLGNSLSVTRSFDEIGYKLEHIDNKVKRNQELINEMKESIKKIDMEKLKEDLQSRLLAVTGAHVSIRLPAEGIEDGAHEKTEAAEKADSKASEESTPQN